MLALLLVGAAAGSYLCRVAKDANITSIGGRSLYTADVLKPTSVAGVFTKTTRAYWLDAPPVFLGSEFAMVACTPADGLDAVGPVFILVLVVGLFVGGAVWVYCCIRSDAAARAVRARFRALDK